ncbi:MAG TPA: Hpt domain-containing protein [Polyangiaceae bacterium]|nr:Hpt domain-containing protein [Polyangiaceae bacterium]
MVEASDPAFDALLRAARVDFANGLSVRVDEIEQSAARGAWVEARRAAHKLRGAAAVYGFGALGAASGELEDLLASCECEPDAHARELVDQALHRLRTLAEAAPAEAR